MKRILGCLLFGSICLLAAAIARAEAISVELIGDDAYPPYSYLENGEAKGIYVDILRDAFSQLDEYELTIRMMPWKRGLALVERGEAVGIFPPYFKPEDRPFMRPYSEPILFELVAVFCDRRALLVDRRQWPDDYYGLRIGNNRGFLTPGPAFFEAVRDGIIDLTEVNDAKTGLKMLLQGRVDCYINDAQAIRWELSHLQMAGKYDPGRIEIQQGATASGEWGYVGFTDRDEGLFDYKDTLVIRLNRVLVAMKKSGRIEEIVEQFFQANR